MPMITSKLVPLGITYEQHHGQCNGFGHRTLEDLLVGIRELKEMRDTPHCAPAAGVVPCGLLDFRKVLSAAQFYHKIEMLYNKHLTLHCNDEWNIHFEALLLRLKGSLTCAGGLQPDHVIPAGEQGHQTTQVLAALGQGPTWSNSGNSPNWYSPAIYTHTVFKDDNNIILYQAEEGPGTVLMQILIIHNKKAI